MSKQTKSNILILIATFIWGTGFLAQKEGADIGTFTFNGTRFLMGGLFLLPMIAIMDAGRAKSGKRIADQSPAAGGRMGASLSWDKTVLIGGIICGIFLFIASTLQQHGVGHTTVGKAGFITSLYILMVPFFSVALGKKVHKRAWLAVVLGIAGLYLMSMWGEDLSLSYGDAFILGCAVALSFQIMAVDYFSPKTDSLKLSCIEFLTIGVISLPLMFIFEDPSVDKLISAAWPLLFAGLLSTGVAYTLQVAAQKDANPTTAALLMTTESLFSLLAGMVVLGERMKPNEYLGAALILIAVIMNSLPEKKAGKEKAEA